MKTIKKTLLTLAVFSAFCLSSSAYDFIVDGIAYNITNSSLKEVEVTRGGNYDSAENPDIVIPEKVTYNNDEYSVTRIGNDAFNRCPNYLKSVVIPEGVTSIGHDAFYDCYQMESVVLPSSLTKIEHRAFMYNFNLNNIVIPEGVTEIGYYAFYGERNNLNNITLPEGLLKIGDWAFGQCSKLTFIEIPSSVISIGNDIFESTPIDSIVYNGKLIEMGKNVFPAKVSFTSLPIDESVGKIPEQAFYGCKGLTNIYISSNVIEIGENAFSGCSNLVSIVVDANNQVYDSRNNCNAIIESSSNKLLVGCNNTQIPEDVVCIGEGAFKDCNKLSAIIIPSSVVNIGSNAFSGCSSLESIVLPEGLSEIGNYVFYDCMKLKEIVIPETVISIGNSSFYNCFSLEKLTMPKGVKSLGNHTFWCCSSLKEINMPDSLKSIGRFCFRGCESIESIIIPEGVTSIGSSAFYGCISLERISIPSTVISMGFSEEYPTFGWCIDLKFIDLKSIVVANSFYHYFREGRRYLDYKNDGGSFYMEGQRNVLQPVEVSFPDGITSICENAFSNCSSLEIFTIPLSVTVIGNNAFSNCYNLTLTIPQNVHTIGVNALNNVDARFESNIPPKLSSELLLGEMGLAIVSPESYEVYRNSNYWHDFMAKIVRSDQLIRSVEATAEPTSSGLHFAIGEENLNSVMDLTVKGSINGIDLLVIRTKMKSLRRLDLSEADIIANDDMFNYYGYGCITADNELGACAFQDLKIRSIILPNNLISIGKESFANCSRLQRIVIPETVKSIEDGSFSNCNSLRYVSIQGGSNIGYSAFRNCSSLDTLLISPNIKTINSDAFNGCRIINDLTFGDSLLFIGSNAFSGNKFKNVSFGKGINRIDYSAFSNCECLKKVILPNNIRTIGDQAFYYCRDLDTLIIGNGIEIIGSSAFSNCSNLEFVSFGKGIIDIKNNAFSYCSKIKTISLPTSLKYIRSEAFYSCTGLQELKIPSSVEIIENYAFGGNRKLGAVYTYTIQPISIAMNTFSCWEYATLFVPKTSYYTYYLNTQWSQFMILKEFDEPYEYFYLNDDYVLNEKTGRIDGAPDMLLNVNSAIIVEGAETQEISEIELTHNGKDGASIIGADGDVTGKIKNLTAKSMRVNIDVEGNRWYFFCFPFNVDLDSVECTSQYVFWRYDGNQRARQGTGWARLQDGVNVLSRGEGYIFQTNKTGILTIHVGSEYLSFASQTEKEVLHTYTSDNPMNASWNFIGNPFISYYDIQDLAEEYDAPIIVPNGRGGYNVYKPGEEGEEPYQLKPFEAFFVQKASGKQAIEFLPENRLTFNQAQAVKLKQANKRSMLGNVINPDRLLVNITLMDQDSITDRTRIVYSNSASMDYEIAVDAPKFYTDGVLQLYSLAGDIKYAINERPMGNDEIKLGYIAPKAGVYTLSIQRMDAEVEVYDNVMNSRVDFIDGNYDFTTKAGTFNNRFVIRKTGDGVTAVGKDIKVDGMILHADGGGIDVSGNAGHEVTVYLPSGALVSRLNGDGFVSTGAGTFIIKVDDRSVKMVVE